MKIIVFYQEHFPSLYKEITIYLYYYLKACPSCAVNNIDDMSDRITSEAIVCLLTNKTKNPPIFQYCYFNCFRFYISKPIAATISINFQNLWIL